MLIRWLMIILILVTVGCGNLTVQDNDDMAKLVRELRQLSSQSRDTLRLVAANMAARAWLKGSTSNDVIGTKTCIDSDGNKESWNITISDMLACLIKERDVTYTQCWNEQFGDYARAIEREAGLNCFQKTSPFYVPDAAPPETDPDRMTDKDILRAIISSDEIPMGYPVEAFGLLPGFCVQGADWACPESPYYPPSQGDQ